MSNKDWSKHAFTTNAQDAIDYGVEEGIVLNTIRQWLHFNETERKNIFDGYVWTYGTGEYYTKFLPMWNGRKISRLLKSLLDKGALIEGNYNRVGYDRTKWYTLPIDGKTDVLPKDQDDTHLQNLVNGSAKSGKSNIHNLVNGSAKFGKPIPTNKTTKKETNKHKAPTAVSVSVPPFVDQQSFDDYLSWRKSQKLSVSKTVVTRLINELNKIEDKNPDDAQKALDNALINGWKKFYPPKPDNKPQKQTGRRDFPGMSSKEILDAMDAEEEQKPVTGQINPFADPLEAWSKGVIIDG